MSVNKKMHPRNIFKTPPSFNELSLKYPEFKKHLKLGLDGKLTMDFHDLEALRMLSKILLLHYFQIKIEIPNDTLVPTIPLRLNYVLWLQDLAQFLQINDKDIHVIDIGAGATCIYGLLMNKLRNWKVLALESDDSNFHVAKSNVELNQMQNFIQVEKPKSKNLLTDSIDPNIKYTFCMCNPPFFDENSEDELLPCKKSKPPKNASTGKIAELSFPGGEVAFIEQLIRESKILKDKILIYTTMIGHKKNAQLLVGKLKSYHVFNFIESEFCQGNTTRWALAWTLSSTIDLKRAPCQKQEDHKKNKSKIQTLTYELKTEQNIHSLFTKLEAILKDMKLYYEILYLSNMLAELKVSAVEDTWSHARRKRREAARKEKFFNQMDSLSKQVIFNDELNELKKHLVDCNGEIATNNEIIKILKKIEDKIVQIQSERKLYYENDFILKNNELLNKLRSIEISLSNELLTLKNFFTLENNLSHCELIVKQIDIILSDLRKRKHCDDEMDNNSNKKFKFDETNQIEESSTNGCKFEQSAKQLVKPNKSKNFIIEFTILLLKVSSEDGIKLTFLKDKGDEDPNRLCQIYNCITNQLK